jgi:hypothetical protein
MSEAPPDVREVVALLDAITPAAEQGPHAAGWSVAVDLAPDVELAVTEAPGGYLVTWSLLEGVALFVDQTAAEEACATVAALARDPGAEGGILDGVLMRASQASAFGFPRMNAIVLGAMRGTARDPWIVWVGSTAPDAKAQGGRRVLPAERARLRALDHEMRHPRVAPQASLAAWLRSVDEHRADYRTSRTVDEAYRVTREPSPHAGWRVTIWRTGDAWFVDVTLLDLMRADAPPGPGVPLAREHIQHVLVFYEGIDGARSHHRAAWCPNDVMFKTFEFFAESAARR